jgi:hypothetical protein
MPRKRTRSYATLDRNGTEDEIAFHAPDGRKLAFIWFWDEEYDQPGVGDKEAKMDAQLILNALNVYRPGAAVKLCPGYQASPGRDPFDCEDAIDINDLTGGTWPSSHSEGFFPLRFRQVGREDSQPRHQVLVHGASGVGESTP